VLNKISSVQNCLHGSHIIRETAITPSSAGEQQVKATFTLRAGVGAVAVGLRIAGAVDAEILSCDWLIAVTWTQFAPLRLSTVEMARRTELWRSTHTHAAHSNNQLIHVQPTVSRILSSAAKQIMLFPLPQKYAK